MNLDMYAEELIYNYEHPKNKGELGRPNAKAHEENISCGDKVTIYLSVEGGIVKDVRFNGSGCVISMGTSSILTEALRGKSLSYIETYGRDRLLKLINIDPGPVRMHCATLALRALRKAALEYEHKPIDSETRDL
ncbi:MAG: iron-sulfur cluster assembly scaffold protein [Candidatus Marsarchaeota archaeon]|nr:iron-sulfur cluster assembly scaffold protein [Candidatus Marsarchaeota archaeon]MCL5413392.1 iron-sulfur cluster assembly scaffold protein [Candidatus Marsarchaeota archaeon]